MLGNHQCAGGRTLPVLLPRRQFHARSTESEPVTIGQPLLEFVHPLQLLVGHTGRCPVTPGRRHESGMSSDVTVCQYCSAFSLRLGLHQPPFAFAPQNRQTSSSRRTILISEADERVDQPPTAQLRLWVTVALQSGAVGHQGFKHLSYLFAASQTTAVRLVIIAVVWASLSSYFATPG